MLQKQPLTADSRQTFHYGSATYQIHPPRNSFPYDLYRTKPFESTRRAVKLPNSSSLFTSPKKASQPSRSGVSDAGRIAGSQVKPDSSKSSTSSSLDADVEALQNSFAAYDAARERFVVRKRLSAPSLLTLVTQDSSLRRDCSLEKGDNKAEREALLWN